MSSPHERFTPNHHLLEAADPEASLMLHKLDVLATKHLIQSLDPAPHSFPSHRIIAHMEIPRQRQQKLLSFFKDRNLLDVREIHNAVTEEFPGSTRLPLSIAAYEDDGTSQKEERGFRFMLAYDVHPPYLMTGSKLRFNTAAVQISLPTSDPEMEARMTFVIHKLGETLRSDERTHVMTAADLTALYFSLKR